MSSELNGFPVLRNTLKSQALIQQETTNTILMQQLLAQNWLLLYFFKPNVMLCCLDPDTNYDNHIMFHTLFPPTAWFFITTGVVSWFEHFHLLYAMTHSSTNNTDLINLIKLSIHTTLVQLEIFNNSPFIQMLKASRKCSEAHNVLTHSP